MTDLNGSDFSSAKNVVPRDYVSTESKKIFTLTAGILGGVFFLGQMVLPMIAMFTMMPSMAETMTHMRVIQPGRGTVACDSSCSCS
ncbi:MAG: hypothetical protein GY854_28890 [Deltaproteobacteria bacterium]|nr:hypothetical protein [Deltaproteobacteria bacterium]